MNSYLSGNTLLSSAIHWFQTTNNCPIPREGSISGVADCSVFHCDARVSLESDGKVYVKDFPASFIPAIAAISLGFDDLELADVLSWHKNSFDDFVNIEFTDPENSSLVQLNNNSFNLTPQEVLIRAAKGYASTPQLLKNLIDGYAANPTHKVSISVMHTDQKTLWPQTQINQHLSVLMGEKPGLIDPKFRDFTFVGSSPRAMTELVNGNAVDHMRRAGMLTESVLRKQGGVFPLWEELLWSVSENHDVQIAMVNSFAGVTDPATISLLKRGLLSATVEATDDETNIAQALPRLRSAFAGSAELASVLTSVMFRMNFIPNNVGLNGLPEIQGETDFFEDIIQDPQTLTSRIAQELMARPVEHLGLTDFAVFSKLRKMDLKDQMVDFSPARLVCHLLDSLHTFVAHRETNNTDKRFIDTKALAGIKDMFAILRQAHEFDYDQLTNRSDNDLLLMIAEGFDIKKFKNLSRRVKGMALDDGLGL
jgi:hypothetical protein